MQNQELMHCLLNYDNLHHTIYPKEQKNFTLSSNYLMEKNPKPASV